MDYIERFKMAETFHEKFWCIVAKILRGHLTTPLGRIILLEKDYKKMVGREVEMDDLTEVSKKEFCEL